MIGILKNLVCNSFDLCKYLNYQFLLINEKKNNNINTHLIFIVRALFKKTYMYLEVISENSRKIEQYTMKQLYETILFVNYTR